MIGAVRSKVLEVRRLCLEFAVAHPVSGLVPHSLVASWLTAFFLFP